VSGCAKARRRSAGGGTDRGDCGKARGVGGASRDDEPWRVRGEAIRKSVIFLVEIFFFLKLLSNICCHICAICYEIEKIGQFF